MKANELRIGSIIRVTFSEDEIGFGKDHNGIIEAIQKSKVIVSGGLHWHPIEAIEPIPLTPSVLDAIDWGGYTDLSINSYFKIDNVGHLYYCGDYTGVNLYHLHQLQNLYFALTGTELEIDLNKLK